MVHFAHYQVSKLKGFSRFEARKPPVADSNAEQNPYGISHSFPRLVNSLGRIEPYIEGKVRKSRPTVGRPLQSEGLWWSDARGRATAARALSNQEAVNDE